MQRTNCLIKRLIEWWPATSMYRQMRRQPRSKRRLIRRSMSNSTRLWIRCFWRSRRVVISLYRVWCQGAAQFHSSQKSQLGLHLLFQSCREECSVVDPPMNGVKRFLKARLYTGSMLLERFRFQTVLVWMMIYYRLQWGNLRLNYRARDSLIPP